ncbi:MAG: helix-turn-helix domain-containing protein [Clostridia bacterium]|nr:helix-turn-helix domain-containing protein [Clostridia bacterium]
MLAMREKRTTPQDPVWCARWLNVKNNYHWHEETEIVYCQSGGASVFAESNEIRIREGESAFIPGESIHKIESDKGAIVITVLIDGTLASSVTDLTPISEKLAYKHDIIAYYEAVKAEQNGKRDFYSSVIKAETIKMLANLLRLEPLAKKERSVTSKYDHYKQILEELQKDFAYITFEEACRRFSYSPSHFSRLIVSLTGTSFTKYMNILRISHAIELLHSNTSLSVTEVARKCGFATIRNFNRSFKELTGYSPTSVPKDFSLDTELRQGTVLNDPTHSVSVMLP